MGRVRMLERRGPEAGLPGLHPHQFRHAFAHQLPRSWAFAGAASLWHEGFGGVPSRSPALVTIIPRWEWRSFGTNLAAAEDVVAALTPGPVEESDELYLLSAAGSNVKVRDDLMDIELLREVDADGLERWEPVMKRGFPLPAAAVSRVFDTLGVLLPPLARDAYTLDQFLAELVAPSGVVRAVRVHKRRQRYTLANCMAEVADLEVDGRIERAIAVESEDPYAVMAAVRRLGLDGQVNQLPAGPCRAQQAADTGPDQTDPEAAPAAPAVGQLAPGDQRPP
jgi:hypothetical protein